MENRKRVGDREGDTIVDQGLARVVTLTERKPGLLCMRRVPSGSIDTVMHAPSTRCILSLLTYTHPSAAA